LNFKSRKYVSWNEESLSAWDELLVPGADKEEKTMYCNYCGKVIPDDANLCAYCGKRVAGVIARERLVRRRQDRKIAGVCAGFAEYFDLDVTLIRIVWVLCVVCGGVGALAYVVCWIVIPEEPLMLQAPPSAQDQPVKT
jgi:phage shock protein C